MNPIPRHMSAAEDASVRELAELMEGSPLSRFEMMANLGLYIQPRLLARVLGLHFLYTKVLEIEGVVMEFGCRWGQNMALFSNLRSIYEPYNRKRTIVGFDTFEGFPDNAVTPKDGDRPLLKPGHLATGLKHESYLSRLLELYENLQPLPHHRKWALVRGDVAQSLPSYLDKIPSTVVALAFFDMDLYKPTRTALELILPRLTRGSVLAFDELNDPDCPGKLTP